MKKQLFTLILFCSTSLFCLATAQTKADTFKIQDFPFKIWYQGQQVKKLNRLEPTLLSKQDFSIRKDWQSSKTIRGVGLGVQAVGVGMMGISLAQSFKGEGGSSLLLGGATVSLGGVIVQIVGISKAKKAMRRYNNIHLGREDTVPLDFKPEVIQKDDIASDTKPTKAPKPEKEQAAENGSPEPPAPRLFPQAPIRTSFFQNGDSLANLKPSAGDIGFGIRADGLRGIFWENNFDSLTLQFRKVMDPKTVYRGDISLVFINTTVGNKEVNNSGGYLFAESSERQFALGFTPAIERHFKGTRRLDPYIGAGLPIVFAGKTKDTEKFENVSGSGTYFKREEIATLPGGFGFGLDGFVGVNYFLAERLSIGLEYKMGLSWLRIKGKTKIKETIRIKTLPTGTEEKTIKENDGDEVNNSLTFFGNKGVAGLNLIFYLGR